MSCKYRFVGPEPLRLASTIALGVLSPLQWKRQLCNGQGKAMEATVKVLLFDGSNVSELKICAHIISQIDAEMCDLVVYIL